MDPGVIGAGADTRVPVRRRLLRYMCLHRRVRWVMGDWTSGQRVHVSADSLALAYTSSTPTTSGLQWIPACVFMPQETLAVLGASTGAT